MEEAQEFDVVPQEQEVDPQMLIVEEVLKEYKKKTGGYRLVRAYLDLAADKDPLGRVEIDLEPNKCPKTVANFAALCAGTMQDEKGKTLHYKGTSVFRMVPKFCMCGGDIVSDNGTGGSSIYGTSTLFNDEKSGIGHSKGGIVSMLQQGGAPNTNGSQFFIVLATAPWLDRINVAFGVVSSGLEMLERVCEKYGTESGVPSKVVRIFDCGLK